MAETTVKLDVGLGAGVERRHVRWCQMLEKRQERIISRKRKNTKMGPRGLNKIIINITIQTLLNTKWRERERESRDRIYSSQLYG